VLHEDKKYYPTALEVYGPDVETLVQVCKRNKLGRLTLKHLQSKPVNNGYSKKWTLFKRWSVVSWPVLPIKLLHVLEYWSLGWQLVRFVKEIT
jgi:hypothetical protein